MGDQNSGQTEWRLGGVPDSEVVLVAAGGSCTSTMSPVGRAGTLGGWEGTNYPPNVEKHS